MTGIDPDASPVDPDLAVALGAAIQAGMLEGSVDRLMVFDVWQVRRARGSSRVRRRCLQCLRCSHR